MEKISITKEFSFEAAHRLLHHLGECSNIHGHSYRVLITINRPMKPFELDGLGMIIDFTKIKETAGEWIQKNLDHAIIIHEKDELLANALIYMEQRGGSLMKHFFTIGNPTAENLALLIYEKINAEFYQTDYHVSNVKVYETQTAYAEVKDV
jgi:6-pyruvoyltetrahydropterin/6-carboxytetrahydropterin synthase